MLQLSKKKVLLPNGETLAYVTYGHGPKTLVLIHGNMSSSLHYLPLIERLGDHYQIIAPDLRGFGDSTYLHPFDSLHELAEDVRAFLAALKIPSAYFAGWSTGGGIVLSLAARDPALVEKIVLIESMSPKGYPIFKKDAAFKPVFGQIYDSKEAMAQDPVQVAPAIAAMASKNFAWMSWLWDLSIYTHSKPTPEANKLYVDETLKQRNLADIDWSLATFNMTGQPNFYRPGDGSITRVKAPVLVIWGKKDLVVPELMTQEIVASLPTPPTLIKNDDSGHSPLVDIPDKLASDIRAFLK